METTTALLIAERRAAAMSDAAAAVGQNARSMVLNRDPRFIDLAALVSQMGGDVRSTALSVSDLTAAVSTLAVAVAENFQGDAATRAQLEQLSADVVVVHEQVQTQAAELVRLDADLDAATAQLAAADEELAARMLAAEQALRDEATIRAAADAAEALARAQADAAEARARADADAANSQKQDQALAAEAAARAAADTKEAADRAAADVALASRVAALENHMPAVTSGRASRAALTLGVGATVDIPVVFDAAATDTNYVPIVVIDAPLLSQWSVVGFTAKTRTGVTVTLRTSAAIALAITLNVTVVALKL